MFVVTLLSLFCLCTVAKATLCPAGFTSQTLAFDDLTTYAYQAMPWPYQGFLFERVNTIYTTWTDFHIPYLNTSVSTYNATYGPALVSPPNIVFTSGESLSLRLQPPASGKKDTFSLLSFYITSIFVDQMQVSVACLSNGIAISNQTVTLTIETATLVTVNQSQIDRVLIGCVDPSFNTCAHMGFDNIAVCHKQKK